MIDQETGEVITPFIRTPYNYDTDNVSQATGMDCGPETKTQQQFRDEVDINTIVERFGQSGELPPTMQFPEAQEFAETFDFQTAITAARILSRIFVGTGYLFAKVTGINLSFNSCCTATTPTAARPVIYVKSIKTPIS